MLGVQCCAIVAIVHATVHVYDSFERTYNEKTKFIGPIFIYVNQLKVTQFMHKSGVEKFVPLMHKPCNSTHIHFQKLGKYMWGRTFLVTRLGIQEATLSLPVTVSKGITFTG